MLFTQEPSPKVALTCQSLVRNHNILFWQDIPLLPSGTARVEMLWSVVAMRPARDSPLGSPKGPRTMESASSRNLGVHLNTHLYK